MRDRIREFLKRYKFTNKLLTNYGFRTIVFSVFSLIIGIAYAVFNFTVSAIYRSVWFGALGCYYMMLDIIRGGVLTSRYKSLKNGGDGENELRETRQYRNCGILLIVMTIFLSAMIILIARQSKTFDYSLTVIYMIAGYTFYRIGISVYNFVKARRQRDYTVRALRCINLAAALVSFLSLQSAALTAFSTGINQIAANALTGGVVCFLIIALGLIMIISAALRLKRAKTTEFS